MSQVSFYTLKSAEDDARLVFACRLAEKAWSMGHQVFLQTQTEEQARLVDDLLWQINPASFIPHGLLEETNCPDSAISISSSLPADSHKDVLINLCNEAHKEHLGFSRINEIINADQEVVALGRKRYRYYQQQGLKPDTHKL